MPASVSNKEKWGKLVDHFAFYAAYHDNYINQWIHIVCVPLILMSAFVMLGYVDLSPYLPAAFAKAFTGYVGTPLSASLLIASFYAAYYLYLQPGWLGASASVMVFVLLLLAVAWRDTFGESMAAAVALHVVGWIAQFYGHGVHEGRAPALLDNLFQALFMAPFFVYIEVLMKMGLLRGLYKAVKPAKDSLINEFRGRTTVDRLRERK